jgi:hypothetical protein
MKTPTKTPTSFRLSETATDLLQKLVDATGIPRGAVLELAIRELARKQGLLDVPREAPAKAAGSRSDDPAAGVARPGANRTMRARPARARRKNPRQTGARGARKGETK